MADHTWAAAGAADVPKGIETETFKQLSRENMPGPPGPPMGGRGPRGGGGFGGDDRWQSGRLPSGEDLPSSLRRPSPNLEQAALFL